MVSVNDIFNKPPTISEDTLQYIIYLPPSQTDAVSATTFATLLLERSQALLPGHLWHRDAFELKVRPDPEGHPEVSVLEGRMRVGDCIDDEWATVWLLRELSRDFDIVIRYVVLASLVWSELIDCIVCLILMENFFSLKPRRNCHHG